MKNIIALLCLISIGITLSAQEFKGNFTKIDASFMYDIEIVKGDKCSVIMECSERMEKYVNIKIEDNTLKLHSIDNIKFNRIKDITTNRIKIYVNVPTLERIYLSGMSKLTSEGKFTADNIKIYLSGMSSIESFDITSKEVIMSISGMSKANRMVINSDELDIDISGMSNAEAKGRIQNTKIDVSGMSKFKGKNLITETGSVSVSGMSKATTSIKQMKKTSSSGMSNLTNSYQD